MKQLTGLYYINNKDGVKERQSERRSIFYKNRKKDLRLFIMGMYLRLETRKTSKKFGGKYNSLDVCKRNEFYKYAENNAELSLLFEEWIKNNREYKLTPTVDRFDSELGYTIDNIQFMALSDNCLKH
jgi:hypothetical protein